MEMDGLQKWVQMESDFSENRSAEKDHLGSEVKQLQSKEDELIEKLKGLKSAPPPAAVTQATYPPAVGSSVPTRTQYGSLIPSQAQMLRHFSPSVLPYQMAAAPAAYAGPSGQALSYDSPQQPPPPPAHQYQGSLQQQVSMALFQSPAVPQPGSPLAQGNGALS